MPIAGTKFVSVARARDSAKWQLPSRRIAAPVIPLLPPALSLKVWPLLHSGPISLSPLSSSSSHIRLLSSQHAATIRTSALSGAGPGFLWLQPANRVLVERAVARPSTKRRPGPLGPGLASLDGQSAPGLTASAGTAVSGRGSALPAPPGTPTQRVLRSRLAAFPGQLDSPRHSLMAVARSGRSELRTEERRRNPPARDEPESSCRSSRTRRTSYGVPQEPGASSVLSHAIRARSASRWRVGPLVGLRCVA